MARVEYKQSSPYAKTDQASWFLSNLTYRDIPRDGTDVLVTLNTRYNLRPDLLSYDLYGTSNYWWTFMILNPNEIKDPVYDFNAGKSIYTSTLSRLGKIL